MFNLGPLVHIMILYICPCHCTNKAKIQYNLLISIPYHNYTRLYRSTCKVHEVCMKLKIHVSMKSECVKVEGTADPLGRVKVGKTPGQFSILLPATFHISRYCSKGVHGGTVEDRGGSAAGDGVLLGEVRAALAVKLARVVKAPKVKAARDVKAARLVR
jgi:hypothetical protein